MKLQTISPDIARQLVELGILNKSYACWLLWPTGRGARYLLPSVRAHVAFQDRMLGTVPAFTACELLAIIPADTIDVQYRNSTPFGVDIYVKGSPTYRAFDVDGSIADTLAAGLRSMVRDGVVSVATVNAKIEALCI